MQIVIASADNPEKRAQDLLEARWLLDTFLSRIIQNYEPKAVRRVEAYALVSQILEDLQLSKSETSFMSSTFNLLKYSKHLF